jgi:FAD/FMN-containing dehydrogenase
VAGRSRAFLDGQCANPVGGFVIDVSPLRSVSVDGGVATVGAGARLGDVYESLAAVQLTIAAGSR